MTYRLILNTPFISLNEYIKAERTNKYIAAKIKKQQTNKVVFLAKSLKFSLPKNKKFDVVFFWYKPNNRKDHDNIAFAKKFIFDGLIEAKILTNDSPKYINNLQDNFELDKDRNYVNCIVEFKKVK